MPVNLRTIVKRHQEERALRAYLGLDYEKTPEEEKRRFIKAVEDSVDKEVDSILNTFVEDVQKGSREKKRRQKRSYLNLGTTLVCTPGIGYGVNLENWILVALFSSVLAAVQIYNISEEF